MLKGRFSSTCRKPWNRTCSSFLQWFSDADYGQRYLKPRTSFEIRRRKQMKRLMTLAWVALFAIGLSMPAWSENPAASTTQSTTKKETKAERKARKDAERAKRKADRDAKKQQNKK